MESNRIVFCREDFLGDTLDFTNDSTFTLETFHTATLQIRNVGILELDRFRGRWNRGEWRWKPGINICQLVRD